MGDEVARRQYREWYERNKPEAKKRKADAMRIARSLDPEHHAKLSRDAARRLRLKLLDTLGRTCAICGFADERALTLDHVLNNGAEERAQLGERGTYRRALDPQHRAEYRILCMNCQFIQREIADRQNQFEVGSNAAAVRRRRSKPSVEIEADGSTSDVERDGPEDLFEFMMGRASPDEP